jgi:hypothetical protein
MTHNFRERDLNEITEIFLTETGNIIYPFSAGTQQRGYLTSDRRHRMVEMWRTRGSRREVKEGRCPLSQGGENACIFYETVLK